MNYTKPEVEVLGSVREVVEALHPKGTSNVEGIRQGNPAYDLDE